MAETPFGEVPLMVGGPPDADGCPTFTKYWPRGAVDMAVYFLRSDGGFTKDRSQSVCAEAKMDAPAPEQQ